MVAEDIGSKRKIEQLLSDRDETLQDVKKTLQGMYVILFCILFEKKKKKIFPSL